MNKIFKTIWNAVRRSYVVVNESVTGAAQTAGSGSKVSGGLTSGSRTLKSRHPVGKSLSVVAVAVSKTLSSGCQSVGKAAVMLGAIGLIFAGSVNAADEYIYTGDYYKKDHSGPYNNTHDYTKATHMVITGSYFHLGDDDYHGNDNAYIGSTDHRGRGYATSTLDVYGNVTVTSRQNVNTALDIGWSNYPDNANGTLNVGGNVLIGGRGGSAAINLAGIIEGKERHDVTGHLNIAGDLTIEQGGSLNLIFGGENNYEGTITASVKTKTLNLYGTILSWPTLFKNKTVNADYDYGDAVIHNGGYLVTTTPTKGVETNTFNTLTLEAGSTLANATGLIIGNKTNGAVTIASTLNLNGGAVGNQGSLSQYQGAVNVNSGSYGFGTYSKSNGVLTNRSTLSITQFNQSNGATSNTGNLTIGNANLYGSLSNTGTLNLTGTVTSRGNLSSSGTLNNKGNWTEANTYAISGNLNNTGSVNFQNGFTLASNSRLTSSGTLQTNNAYNIFDSLGTTGQQDLHYVSLNSTAPQEIKTSLSDFFQKYVAGTVAQDLINHASFTGGKVIITGVNITQTQADDLVNAFKSKIYLPLEQLKTAHLSTFSRKVLG